MSQSSAKVEAPVLIAGAACSDITPEAPFDIQPNLRGCLANSIHSPLQCRVCVLRTETDVAVIVTADLLGAPVSFASKIRTAVAAATEATPSAVLVNFSHTHAAPAPHWPYKIGSAYETLAHTDAEVTYYETLPERFAATARLACARLRPAVVSGGVGHAPGIAVNRRERTADGRTILGWNPAGFVDDEVTVINVDGLDGAAVATLVGFGCHPVTLGCRCGDAAFAAQDRHFFELSADFVGAVRATVESWRGGTCLYLQGAAGNVMPLETFNDHPGVDAHVGRRIGIEAVHATVDSPALRSRIERLEDEHLAFVDFGLYRRRVAPVQPPTVLQTSSRTISLPLLPPPAAAELRAELEQRSLALEDHISAGGNSGMFINQQRYHLTWLRRTLESLDRGNVATALDGEIWTARIGDFAIAAAPAEIFSETGYRVRGASKAKATIFAGYSNGVLGYVPTPEEYPYGGYEPAIAHRGYGQPAAFSPEVAGLIEGAAVEAVNDLFASAQTHLRGD